MSDKIQPASKRIDEGGAFKNPENYMHITTPHDPADGTIFNVSAGQEDNVFKGPTSHSYHKKMSANISSNEKATSFDDRTYGSTVGKARPRNKKF